VRKNWVFFFFFFFFAGSVVHSSQKKKKTMNADRQLDLLLDSEGNELLLPDNGEPNAPNAGAGLFDSEGDNDSWGAPTVANDAQQANMANPQVLPPALLDELQAQQANMVNPQVLPLAVLDELQAQQADMVNPQVLPPALLDELQAQQANMVNPQVLPLAVLDELQAQQADMVNPQVLPPALLDQPPEQNKKAKKKPRAQNCRSDLLPKVRSYTRTLGWSKHSVPPRKESDAWRKGTLLNGTRCTCPREPNDDLDPKTTYKNHVVVGVQHHFYDDCLKPCLAPIESPELDKLVKLLVPGVSVSFVIDKEKNNNAPTLTAATSDNTASTANVTHESVSILSGVLGRGIWSVEQASFSAKKSAEESAEESAEKSANVSAKVSVDESAEESAEESPKPPSSKRSRKVLRRVTKTKEKTL
jgi:hypothetical protein